MEFYEVKERLPMEKLLAHYGIDSLKKSGNSLYGPCPIHRGDNPTAFRVSLDKNLWHCFTKCGGGSVIDFIMQMEGLSKYEAFNKAKELMDIRQETNKTKQPIRKPSHNTQDTQSKERINPPLEFRLTLDPKHPYLEERGINPETIKHFEIGYCNKGIFEGRIVIPIHNENGELVAYCSRSVDDSEPKYEFPNGFSKNLVVYNFHRVKDSKQDKIVLVEGYFDLYRLYQAGFDAVALMGCSISKEQEKLITSLSKELVLLFDGDNAGRNATKKAIEIFKGKVPLQVKYLDGVQPDHFKEDELKEFLR